MDHSPKEISQSQDGVFYPSSQLLQNFTPTEQTVACHLEETQEPYSLFAVASVQFDRNFPFDTSTKMKFLSEIAKKDIADGKLTLKSQSPATKDLLKYMAA